MAVTFPNETPEYRRARRALLDREVELRREMEAVAVELRALPPGGAVPEDYRFDCIGADGAPSTVRLSQLFERGDSLLLVASVLAPAKVCSVSILASSALKPSSIAACCRASMK